MRLLKRDLRHGRVLVAVQSLDDLWYLSQIVEKGDFVRGKTTRKLKLGSDKVAKKTMTLTLAVEGVEFHEHSNVLRVSGVVAEETEDVPKGSHHTLAVEPGTRFTLIKQDWLGYQLDRLKEATEERRLKLLLVVFDRETALFALLKSQGYDLLSELKGKVAKKGSDERSENFYAEIIKTMKEYVKRFGIEAVILASPSFWKEELLKELDDAELKKRIVQATCSDASRNGIEEVLRRDELKEVLKQERVAKEERLVEELMQEISREGKMSYGFEQVSVAATMGAVQTLLLTDKFLHRMRSQNEFERLDAVMKATDRAKGRVFIINSKNAPGKRLDGLGGIAALLRFKLSY